MKAMCQAAWLLTVASGNFIVLILAESSAFENQVGYHILMQKWFTPYSLGYRILFLCNIDWCCHIGVCCHGILL